MNKKNTIGWAVAAGFIAWFAACYAAQAQDVCGKWTLDTKGVDTYERTCTGIAPTGEVRIAYWMCAVEGFETEANCMARVYDVKGRLRATVTSHRGGITEINGKPVAQTSAKREVL